MNPLTFKLSAPRLPVVMEDDNGTSISYELREMTAASRDRYLDRLSERMRVGTDGKPAGLKKFEGLHAELLSQCLFKADGENVPVVDIQKWPSHVVSELFTAAQKLNRLGAEEDGTPKNALEVKG